jgi:hypothetical protein
MRGSHGNYAFVIEPDGTGFFSTSAIKNTENPRRQIKSIDVVECSGRPFSVRFFAGLRIENRGHRGWGGVSKGGARKRSSWSSWSGIGVVSISMMIGANARQVFWHLPATAMSYP